MSELTIKEFVDIKEALRDICKLEKEIFDDPYSEERILCEASTKNYFSVLIAYNNEEQAVGYKAGYELKTGLFYSWIGGVTPKHRRKGISSALMKKQHELVKDKGYQRVRTHTHNKFREMLLLNIKNGFDIIGTYNDISNGKPTIMLEKFL